MPRSRRPFCADLARGRDEPLSATASRVDHWLVVEYHGLWARDPIGGSRLSDAVKAHLRAQLAALPRSRLLFVRRPHERDREGVAVFVARSREWDRRLAGARLGGYDELLSVDARSLLEDARPGPPLLVVCAHGKRDRCCALYGRPVYEELRAGPAAERVWQSTHVGGDRFAGNLVSLPDGLYFGHVGPGEAEGVAAALAEHRIDLGRYRGRSCFPFPVQAGERRIREETGRTGIDELAFAGWEPANGGWRVRFREEATGATHEAEVEERIGDPAFLTCGAEEERRPRRYVATDVRPV
jgi:hypothetical protein